MRSSAGDMALAGLVSSLAVAAAAAACARREGRPAWRPINAISHIYWGPGAAERSRLTLRYSGLGLLLNLVACAFWAAIYHLGRRGSRAAGRAGAALRGVAVSALAYSTDYHLVPRRLTPGFELSLSRKSFPWIYGALAIGLCLPDLIRSKGTRSRI